MKTKAVRVAILIGLGALAGSSFAAASDSMAGWRAYGQSAIQPDFAWANKQSAKAPTVLDQNKRMLQRKLSIKLSLASLHHDVNPSNRSASMFDSAPLMEQTNQVIQSDFIGSTVSIPVDEATDVQVTGIFASQRFADPSLGLLGSGQQGQAFFGQQNDLTQQQHGWGLRTALVGQLSDDWHYQVSYQSRIRMGTFEGYRGVFREPGQFDLPANTRLDVRYALNDWVQLGVSAERVFYNDITPFTSNALPERFLSLLGDGVSPTLRWRDLNVQHASVRFGSDQHHLLAHASSDRQPTPTSNILARALKSNGSELTFGLRYFHQVDPHFWYGFSAAVAPYRYLTTYQPQFRADDASGRQVELEARLGYRF